MSAVGVFLHCGHLYGRSYYASVVVGLTISLEDKFHPTLHSSCIFTGLLETSDFTLRCVCAVLVVFGINLG